MFPLPPVPTGQELLDRGFRQARKVRSAKGRTPLDRARSRSMQQLTAFGRPIREALRKISKAFPSLDDLPPYERELLDVTAGVDDTKRHLASTRWAEQQVAQRVRESRAAVRNSGKPAEMERARKACYGRVASVLREVEVSLDFLREVRQALRRVPGVDEDLPTLVIAGAPNVGKSLLVQALSRARPQVATYPFTTQDLSLGHFEFEGLRLQVLDTPGLLDRPVSERNETERKALVALRHLADAIVFLLDPTGTSGYPLDEQEALLADLRMTFPDTPFVEVENKADLGPGTGGRRHISALTGRGLCGLQRDARAALTNLAPAAALRPKAE
ncbi:MAG: NOG1 family protein [Thermoplasmata archaeon]